MPITIEQLKLNKRYRVSSTAVAYVLRIQFGRVRYKVIKTYGVDYKGDCSVATFINSVDIIKRIIKYNKST